MSCSRTRHSVNQRPLHLKSNARPLSHCTPLIIYFLNQVDFYHEHQGHGEEIAGQTEETCKTTSSMLTQVLQKWTNYTRFSKYWLFLLIWDVSTVQSLYNAMFGSIGMEHITTESCFKGTFYIGIIEKSIFLYSLHSRRGVQEQVELKMYSVSMNFSIHFFLSNQTNHMNILVLFSIPMYCILHTKLCYKHQNSIVETKVSHQNEITTKLLAIYIVHFLH